MLLVSTCLLVLPLVAAPPRADTVALRVEIDSSRREVVVTVGPLRIAHMPKGMDHGQMHQMEGTTSPLLRFVWPIEAWFRGFELEVTDAGGKLLDPRLVHHMNVMNFDRRQLLYPAVERMVAAGSETGTVIVPKSIGMPMQPGYRLGMYVAWNNTGDADIEDAYLRVRLKWSPKNLSPRPLDVLPLYMDVSFLEIGETDSYDLPPGHSTKSYDFTLPVGGRMLAVGGHMHDYGTFVQLEDATTGKVIVRLVAKKDAEGRLLKMPTKYFGITGDGIRLREGRRYRVRADYDNPESGTIPDGAMGLMAAAFVPDDYSKWPVLDPHDPNILKDVAALEKIGKSGNAQQGARQDEHAGHEMPAKPATTAPAGEHKH
jgi:hypothetical protein